MTKPIASGRHIKLRCGTKLYLSDLETAGLSYVPCGQDREGKDTPLLPFSHLWKSGRQVKLSSYGKKANAWALAKMTGVQLMTGKPSRRGEDLLTDIDIEYRFIEKYPKLHQRIRDMYVDACEGSPCIVITKSLGERLTGFCEYLDRKRPYTDKDRTPDEVKSKKKPMLVEFFSEQGLSRLDHRYTIEQGSVLALPSFPRLLLQDIHKILIEVADELTYTPTSERSVVGTSQIGDIDVHWGSDNRSQLFPSSHCQIASHSSNRNEVRFTRYSDGSIDGHCFNCGESWWEVEPPQRRRSAKVRLKVSEYERETQSLDDQREMLSQEVQKVVSEKREEDGKHLINVTSAAGTGKTTIIITTYENLFFLSRTVEESDQAFSIADELGRDCWRHRPRMHNFKEYNWAEMPFGLGANERPCMYPKVCNDLVLRGHEVVPTFCTQRCEYYAECRDVGFLKQLEIEPAKQSVFMSWNEMVFSDVRFESRMKKICAGEKLPVLDEANATNLPQQRLIPAKDLLDVLDGWRLPTPAAYEIFIILENLIQELSTAKKPQHIRDAFVKALRLLTDDEISKIDDALSKIPVGLVWDKDEEGLLYATAIYKNSEKKLCLSDYEMPPEGFDGTIPRAFAEAGVEIDKFKLLKIDLSMFEQFGFCDMIKDAASVPRRLVNFLTDIKTFVDCGSNACFKLDSGDIEFYLPPGLNAPIAMTLTASDTDDLISEVYRPTDISVTTITAPPPPFMPGNKVFQIGTGRYTAKSALLERSGEDVKYTADGTEISTPLWKPKQILKRMLKTVLKAGERYIDGKPRYRETLVVGAKDLVENTEDPLLEEIHENPFIDFVNHHHAEGRNDYQHCEIAFIFHSEPSVIELQKIAQITFPNESLSFQREEVDLCVDGVTLEKVMRYTDERVQKVYNRECESRLMQAMMRLRPMINENKLIFLFTAEPVRRIPVAPIPFTLPQLERFLYKEQGDITEFEAYLNELEEMDVKELAEKEGISERAVYKKNGDAIKQRNRQKKAEKDTEMLQRILAYKAENPEIGERKIAKALGFSYGKVRALLKTVEEVH